MKNELIIAIAICLVILIIVLAIYFSIGHKYVVKGERLIRYDVGGKHDHEPSAIVNINTIKKIKRVERSGKLKRLKIYLQSDPEPIMTIKSGKLEQILKQLKEANNQIKVI